MQKLPYNLREEYEIPVGDASIVYSAYFGGLNYEPNKSRITGKYCFTIMKIPSINPNLKGLKKIVGKLSQQIKTKVITVGSLTQGRDEIIADNGQLNLDHRDNINFMLRQKNLTVRTEDLNQTFGPLERQLNDFLESVEK